MVYSSPKVIHTRYGTDFGALNDPDNKVTKAYRDVFKQDSYIAVAWQVAEIILPANLITAIP